jgi:hypothetical protein
MTATGNVAGVIVRGGGGAPVPDNSNVRGLFSAFEVMVRVPVLRPAAVGVNTTVRVHAVPSRRGEAQAGDVIWKSPEIVACELTPPTAALY